MGMEYARLYFDFFTSEKTQYLLDECGDSGLICLMRLWVRAGQRNNDGIFKKSPRALEKIAGWKGEKGKLIKTLTDPDFTFLDKLDENEFSLHSWEKNNPHLAEKEIERRVARARKAGLASAAKKKEQSTTSQLQVNSPSTGSQLNSTTAQLDSTNVTKHNVTKHNVTKEKSKKKKSVRRPDIPYEEILKHYNDLFEADYRADTEATIVHINNSWDYASKSKKYKDDPIQAFYLVNKRTHDECISDPGQLKWSKPSNIWRMGPRHSNFENILEEPKEQEYDPGVFG